jgi:hypothetical protein
LPATRSGKVPPGHKTVHGVGCRIGSHHLEKLSEKLRRVFEVDVRGEDEISSGFTHAGEHRRGVAEVAGELNQPYPRIELNELLHDIGASIRRAIVDKDELNVVGDVLRLFRHRSVEGLDEGFRLVHRRDDAELHLAGQSIKGSGRC